MQKTLICSATLLHNQSIYKNQIYTQYTHYKVYLHNHLNKHSHNHLFEKIRVNIILLILNIIKIDNK